MELVDRNKCALNIGDVVVTVHLYFAIITRRTAHRISVEYLPNYKKLESNYRLGGRGSMLNPNNVLLAHPVCPKILHNAKIIRKLLK